MIFIHLFVHFYSFKTSILTLFETQMLSSEGRCHTVCIPGCACERLVFPIRNVFIGFGVNVLFSQTEVNNVNVLVLKGKIRREIRHAEA